MSPRVVLLGSLLAALGACEAPPRSVGDCGDGRSADLDHLDLEGQPDPCHLHDPPDAGDGCAQGEYMHWTANWEEPTWLWFGPEEQAPACPSMSTAYEGHADLVAPLTCEACTCAPPTGSCALPSTLTASSAACNLGGAPTAFDAPAPWDGQCNASTQVPAGKAESLTIDALAMSEDGCVPGSAVPAKVISSHWKTYACGCDGARLQGPRDRSICATEDLSTEGFHLCVFRSGEVPCSAVKDNAFTERHVFYGGIQDDRQCSECICEPPTGSVCTATISTYKGSDPTCSGPTVTKTTASSAKPTCIDIQPPGQSLGSKSAGPATYTPGMCQPAGGQPVEGMIATGIDPTTFCCKP